MLTFVKEGITYIILNHFELNHKKDNLSEDFKVNLLMFSYEI